MTSLSLGPLHHLTRPDRVSLIDMQEVKLFVLPLRSSFRFRANETHQKITDRAMLELMVFLVEYRNLMYNYIPRELAKS